MSRKTVSAVIGSFLVVGFALGAVQGCGSSSSGSDRHHVRLHAGLRRRSCRAWLMPESRDGRAMRGRTATSSGSSRLAGPVRMERDHQRRAGLPAENDLYRVGGLRRHDSRRASDAGSGGTSGTGTGGTTSTGGTSGTGTGGATGTGGTSGAAGGSGTADLRLLRQGPDLLPGARDSSRSVKRELHVFYVELQRYGGIRADDRRHDLRRPILSSGAALSTSCK